MSDGNGVEGEDRSGSRKGGSNAMGGGILVIIILYFLLMLIIISVRILIFVIQVPFWIIRHRRARKAARDALGPQADSGVARVANTLSNPAFRITQPAMAPFAPPVSARPHCPPPPPKYLHH